MSTTKGSEFSSAQLRKKLAQQLRGNYVHNWDEDRDALCARILKELQAEIGNQRLEQAVYACIDYENFFSAENLRKHIPAVENRRRVLCHRCRDSEGWLYVLVEGDRSKRPRVYRCPHNDQTHFEVIVGPSTDRQKRQAVACDYVEQQVTQ